MTCEAGRIPRAGARSSKRLIGGPGRRRCGRGGLLAGGASCRGRGGGLSFLHSLVVLFLVDLLDDLDAFCGQHDSVLTFL